MCSFASTRKFVETYICGIIGFKVHRFALRVYAVTFELWGSEFRAFVSTRWDLRSGLGGWRVDGLIKFTGPGLEFKV